ncbi:hypothetical protein HaLaN_11095 [Haematococcus lacustris]|uniref:Uncharacterized protein n=1 Tax=Haematococcus lacustris TaxID=44745 RepID=A0A699ZH63_HAELA|nr:hypothetical protein HaLaN_11095 [Haematococcus lacustris]
MVLKSIAVHVPNRTDGNDAKFQASIAGVAVVGTSAACTAKLVLEVSQRANTTNATQLTTGITQAVDSFLVNWCDTACST